MLQKKPSAPSSPRRDNRSPFDLLHKSNSRQTSQNSPSSPVKYSFITAISQLQQFKSASEQHFLKKMRDTDAEIVNLSEKLKLTFTDLETKLNRVIQKHELDYNEAYKIMLQRKEKDLRVLIDRVREKIAQDMFKDQKIKKLEQQIAFIRAEAIRLDKSCKSLRDQTSKYKSQLDVMKMDNKFLKEQVLDLNRQNKALKLGLTKLSQQYVELGVQFQSNQLTSIQVKKRTDLIEKLVNAENLDLSETIDDINLSTQKVDTKVLEQQRKRQDLALPSMILTGSANQDTNDLPSPRLGGITQLQQISIKQPEDGSIQALQSQQLLEEDDRVFQTSLIINNQQQQKSTIDKTQSLVQQKNIAHMSSTQAKQRSTQRIKFQQYPMHHSPSIQQIRRDSLNSSTSPENNPLKVLLPVKNLKFRAILNTLIDGGVTRGELQQELMQYVNNLQQRLNAKVDIMRDRLEREKRKIRLLKVQIPVAKAIDKNQYEALFFQAVESVRKQVAKRKLKGEMLNKKVFMNSLKATHRGVAEQSASMIVGIVHNNNSLSAAQNSQPLKDQKLAKLDQLTQTDRLKILDLFVGNEKVVTKVFDLIFPSKPSGLPQASHINIDSGGGHKNRNYYSNSMVQDSLLNLSLHQQSNNNPVKGIGITSPPNIIGQQQRSKPSFSNNKLSSSMQAGPVATTSMFNNIGSVGGKNAFVQGSDVNFTLNNPSTHKHQTGGVNSPFIQTGNGSLKGVGGGGGDGGGGVVYLSKLTSLRNSGYYQINNSAPQHPEQQQSKQLMTVKHSYSHNQSFSYDGQFEKKDNTALRSNTLQNSLNGIKKSSFKITNQSQLQAVGREMNRKKIKPNVYLKSGLIAALASHRRSLSKSQSKYQ